MSVLLNIGSWIVVVTGAVGSVALLAWASVYAVELTCKVFKVHRTFLAFIYWTHAKNGSAKRPFNACEVCKANASRHLCRSCYSDKVASRVEEVIE